MDSTTILLIMALVFGFYMAWSLGANDAANALGTSVGSGALTLRKAVIIAAGLEFCGAFLFGSNVSDTVQNGIVNPEFFVDDPMLFAYGMLGALLASGVWLQLASYFGWPVSTTHAIIGAVLGFGLVIGGPESIHWGQVAFIAMSWVFSPLMGGIIAFITFTVIRKRVLYSRNPVLAAKKIIPMLVFLITTMLSLAMIFRTYKQLSKDVSFLQILAIALAIGFVGNLISRLLLRKVVVATDSSDKGPLCPDHQALTLLRKVSKNLTKLKGMFAGELYFRVATVFNKVEEIKDRVSSSEEECNSHGNMEIVTVEKLFGYLQMLSACFMAFAHGANDVANAMGPLAACVSTIYNGAITLNSTVPLWILALGGGGIILGLATWGWRVIETIGKKITELTPSRGFAAEMGASTTIVLASAMGLPVSTTHTLVGAVLGVGLARGIHTLNLGTIKDIVISWVVTIPVGAVMTVVFFYVLRWIFG